MSDPYSPAIENALIKLRIEEAKVLEMKKTINGMRALAGQEPLFDLGESPAHHSHDGGMRGDEYYGKPLATVVREVLERRHRAKKGPASVDEIYSAMILGGYKFESKEEDTAKRGLRISLTKNSSIFHRLPRGDYGLLEWYPQVKKPKEASEQEVIERVRLKDAEEPESPEEAKEA